MIININFRLISGFIIIVIFAAILNFPVHAEGTLVGVSNSVNRGYDKYMNLSRGIYAGHSAFAIGSNNRSWGYSTNEGTITKAKSEALKWCNKNGYNCKVIAFDGKINKAGKKWQREMRLEAGRKKQEQDETRIQAEIEERLLQAKIEERLEFEEANRISTVAVTTNTQIVATPDSFVRTEGNRVALVIGNGAYGSIGALSNPPNDARLMAGTLRQLGFEVIEKINASQKTMKRAVRNFGTLLQKGGDDVVGLFFYAGHGVQVKGANYIIPVDAEIDKEGDVDIEAIDANSVMAMMEHSGAGLNFVILDACRNNPFTRSFRSGTRGLAEMDAPTGSFIAYATSPGDVAADGDGTNSPYTTALTNAMLEPGIAVEQMFRKVRNVVRENTNNDQTPWESSSLIGGNFYFNPASSQATQAAVTTATNTASQQNTLTAEMMFWQSIQNSTDVAMFEAYISQYPSGSFAPLARVKISTLNQTQVAILTPSRAPVNECDTLAANSDDPEKVVSGILFDDVIYDSAIKACKNSIKQYPDEQRFKYQLGRSYHKKDNLISAVLFYRQAANNNYTQAIYSLAFMYYEGLGVLQDSTAALRLYRKAAATGHSNAQTNLGLMYYYGDGVPKNKTTARNWYQKAADQGHERAGELLEENGWK